MNLRRKMKYLYIVAAAGSGKRMGLSTPKQFLEFQGEPIFIKTLKVIEKSELVTDIIVVTGEEHIDTVANYCKNLQTRCSTYANLYHSQGVLNIFYHI